MMDALSSLTAAFSSSAVEEVYSPQARDVRHAEGEGLLYSAGNISICENLEDEEDGLLVTGTDRDTQESKRFIWNNKECTGNALHLAVRWKNYEAVASLLEQHPKLINSRFHYNTEFNDATQAGTGEAIHIAASHREKDLITLLLERGASPNAKVTRGSEDHYATLHAAIFAEGQGGSPEVVQLLLDVKAKIEPNSLGLHPMHLAFMTGKVDLIELLRHEGERQGLPDVEDEANLSGKTTRTPLQVGISSSGMSTKQLVDASRLKADSLRTFALMEPQAIPMWLERLTTSQDFDLAAEFTKLHDGTPLCVPAYLAQLISVKELASVLAACPSAADALLTAVTSVAHCRNQAMHPLPRKVRLTPRPFLQRTLGYFNPPVELLPAYRSECMWEFDGKRFRGREWHKLFMPPLDADRRRAQLNHDHDAEILVCYITDLASAEFFLALNDGLCRGSDGDTTENLKIFNNDVVKALVSLVWWEGAVLVEFVNAFLDFWGLALLLAEMWVVQTDALERQHHGRELLHTHSADDFFEHDGQYGEPLPFIIAGDFLVARGLLFWLHELHRLLAVRGIPQDARSRSVWGYLQKRRIFGSAILILVWVDLGFIARDATHLVRLIAIWSHWVWLVSENLWLEPMCKALLPLTDIVSSLWPSFALTMTFFFCYTHMRLYLMGCQLPWRVVIQNSFLTLFVGELENTTDQFLDSALTYIGIASFSLFFLNIFIGVISEAYTKKAELSSTRYQQLLSSCCANYLVRWRLMPNLSIGLPLTVLISVAATSGMFALQVYAICTRKTMPYSVVIFLAAMVILDFVSFTWHKFPWIKDTGDLTQGEGMHLWFARKVSLDNQHSHGATISRLQQALKELNHENQSLRSQQNVGRRSRAASGTSMRTSTARSLKGGVTSIFDGDWPK